MIALSVLSVSVAFVITWLARPTIRRRVGSRLLTTGWMSVLFGVLLLAPFTLPRAIAQEFEPWRFLVISGLGALLYWYKHPGEHVRAVAIGSLVLVGFNLKDVLPSSLSEEFATLDEETGEEGTASLADFLAVPVLAYALVLATNIDRRLSPPASEPKGASRAGERG